MGCLLANLYGIFNPQVYRPTSNIVDSKSPDIDPTIKYLN